MRPLGVKFTFYPLDKIKCGLQNEMSTSCYTMPKIKYAHHMNFIEIKVSKTLVFFLSLFFSFLYSNMKFEFDLILLLQYIFMFLILFINKI